MGDTYYADILAQAERENLCLNLPPHYRIGRLEEIIGAMACARLI